MPDQDEPQATATLEHNDSAVIKHMEMYQSIITRMAANSAACKQWCIPLITAILAFVVKDKSYELVLLTIIPLLIFYCLDSYYLMLENRFRDGFNLAAEKIQKDTFSQNDLFKLKPESSQAKLLLKAFTSPATWPVYFGLFVLLIVAYKLAIGAV